MRAKDAGLCLCVCILMFVLGVNSSNVFTIWLFAILGLLFLFYGLAKILLADDYFELKNFNKKGKVKIYVYEDETKDAGFQVYIECFGYTDVFYIDDYEFFRIGKKRDWFIFALKGDWFCQYFDEIIPLGKRVGRAIFIDKNKDEDFFRVSALSLKNEIKTYEANEYYCKKDELFIPDLADGEDKKTDYMLVKIGLEYKLISSLHVWKKKREMMLAGIEKYRSVIFKQDEDTVIIIWDEHLNSYKEIYRAKNKVCSFKRFVEVQNDTVPGYGTVYKFDRHKRSLKDVYIGYITGIDEQKRLILGKSDKDVFSY